MSHRLPRIRLASPLALPHIALPAALVLTPFSGFFCPIPAV